MSFGGLAGAAKGTSLTGSAGSINIGDPFSIANGQSHEAFLEAVLPTGNRTLNFVRYFVSHFDVWTYYPTLRSVPKPYGSDPQNQHAARWWHSLFSVVRMRSVNEWLLLDTSGHQYSYRPCTIASGSTSCFATNGDYSYSLRRRLERTPTGFIFHQDNSLRYHYQAHHVHEGISFYFLSRIDDSAGNTLLTLAYAPPTGLTCPMGESGSHPGVPYLSTATTSSGTQLLFTHKALARSSSVTECVLDSIDIKTAGTTAQRLVSYTYTLSGSVERPGLLSSAAAPSRTAGHPQRVETYDYSATHFRVSRDGKTVAHHTYENSYYARVLSTQSPSESLSVSWGARGSCQPGSNCCGTTPYVRNVTTQSAGRGDGQTGSPGFSQAYEVLPMASGNTFHEARLYRTVDSCTVPESCSPGSIQYEWACTDSTFNFPGYEKGVKDKRGNWTVNLFSAAPSGKPKSLTEKTAILFGATDATGTGALERTDFTYTYGHDDVQLKRSEQRPSVLAPPGETAPFARTEYVYEPPGTLPPNQDRQKATLRSGWTRELTSSGWTTPKKTIGHFTFTARTTGDTTPDPLGRVLEEHGPCYVDASSSTPSDCPTGANFPITRYFYWPQSSGTPAAGHLQKVVVYPSNSMGASPLETKYNTYDVWGNPTQIETPDGTVINNTYIENRLVTSQTGSQLPLEFGYLDDKLAYVKYRAANSYEVFCYRTGISSTSCSGTLTENLQWKARATNADGSGWVERLEYTYWPDGTLKEERHVSMNGGTAETRLVMSYAADAHKRPVLKRWGEGTGSYSSASAFDGANNVTGIGDAFNQPPAWCGGVTDVISGSPLSELCSHPSYDRANRMESLLQSPGGSAPAVRTHFSRDVHGNIIGIKVGCPPTSTFQTCSQPSSSYIYDDFGRLVEAAPSHVEGPLRFSYDARDNHTIRETAAMRAINEYVEYIYDNASRLTRVAKVSASSTTPLTLYRLGYDSSGTPPTSCGSGLDLSTSAARTIGRLRYTEDSFGFTWYRYNDDGHVTAEVRARDGSCGTDTHNNPHTLYSYTIDGALEQITYPYGRRVRYVYGTGALSHRISGIEATLHDGTSWGTPRLLVSDVRWEPYGDLRSYRIHHINGIDSALVDYMAGGNANASTGGCSSSPPSTGTGYDLTKRLRSLRVTTSAAASGAGDLFQRNYQWQADQIVRADTCVLGSTPRTESLSYDRTLRLTGAQLTGSHAGSSSLGATYSYDGRSNRATHLEDGFASTPSLASSSPADWIASLTSQYDAALQARFSYDADGRAIRKAQGKWLSGTDADVMTFTYGQSATVATDTVFRAVMVNGVSFNYYYDAEGRRRAKAYEGGAKDEFFYDRAKNLLVDQGNESASPAYFVSDDYIWLADRPVALIRGRLSLGWTRQSDSLSACDRDGQPAACGVYHLVTDHVAKPVLTLDAQLRVTDVTDHDPFGLPNHVTLHASTPHPYPNNLSSTLADFTQVAGTPNLTLQTRLVFHLVDTEALEEDGLEDDNITIKDGDTNTLLATLNGRQGRLTTNWLHPSAGRITVEFASGPNSNPSHSGAILEAYEYRRFQTGTQPFAAPLRFPGQYHDSETNFFENWNRYLDPSIGRYAQPEPLLEGPAGTQLRAKQGRHLDSYSYARNNPFGFIDSTGRADTLTTKCAAGSPSACAALGYESAEAAARAAALATAGATVASSCEGTAEEEAARRAACNPQIDSCKRCCVEKVKPNAPSQYPTCISECVAEYRACTEGQSTTSARCWPGSIHNK